MYEVPENVLVEVEDERGDVSLAGSGQLLVSVLGLEDPKLIRWRIGDIGNLDTGADGRQMLDVLGRGDISVKFHLDSVGGSVILQKSTVTEFLGACGVPSDLDMILNIHNHDGRTVVEVNLVADGDFKVDLKTLRDRLNSDFPVQQLRGRFQTRWTAETEARGRISPGKRRFFVKSY